VEERPINIRKLIQLSETLEAGSPALIRFPEQISRALTLRMAGYFDTYKQRPFTDPRGCNVPGAWKAKHEKAKSHRYTKLF